MLIIGVQRVGSPIFFTVAEKYRGLRSLDYLVHYLLVVITIIPDT